MRVWCTILFYSVALLGCVDDAPRDNPLDPLSPKYKGEGSLIGRTITIKPLIGDDKITGVAGVVISHLESGIFVITDSAGYFAFNNLQEGLQSFLCTKQNFTSDTFQVQIQSRTSTNVVRELNGAPVVLFQKILTRKVDHVSQSTEYFVDIEAEVTDPNEDLDSVWFNVVDTMYFPMLNSIGSNKFVASLKKLRFPTNTISWLIGKELHIVSRDKNLAINISTPFFITQIIENTSTPLSPSSFESVNHDSLIFKWKPPDVTFNYTSTVTIYRAGTDDVLSVFPGITSNNEQYPEIGSVVSIPIDGNCFWTVTIVDEFGNYSRSKESYFTVQ